MGDMDAEFLRRIDRARDAAGVPFFVNSAYRTVEHEISRGRCGTSSHTKGVALDIRAADSRTRFMILKALMDAGFARIGIHGRFIHVDADDSKDPCVLWKY